MTSKANRWPGPERAIFQAKPFVAIRDGVYEAQTTVGELKKHGSMGQGSPTGLDGELVVIDGRFYHVDVEGVPHELSDEAGICFAQVSFFEPTGSFELPRGTSLVDLPSVLDPLLPTLNAYYALHLRGKFVDLKLRSFDAPQKGPDGKWPPLWQVLANQNVFHVPDASARLIGFRSPPYVTDFWGFSGYHMHCMVDGETRAGHALGFVLEEGVVELERIDRWVVDLPRGGAFDTTDLSYIIEQSGPCYPGCSPLSPSKPAKLGEP